MTVRFAVLGPVEVTAAGRPLPGLAPRHRAVLAYLLLHARTVISSDRLTSALWADSPPETSRAQIHAAVTGIRRSLRTTGAGDVLATRAAGYVITPGPGALDVAEFTRLVDSAQDGAATDPAAAAARLRDALSLWRGDALTGIKAEYAPGARARLEERRLAAVERLADVELALGRSDSLVEELGTWVSAYPLRERLVGQLMRALQSSGRQADALAAGRRYRENLAEQQGLDPGRTFLALEQAILRDQPMQPAVRTLAATQRPAPDDQVDAAGRRANFLPYDLPDFTGRAVELDRLVGGLATRVFTIDGMAGVGKTALAVHAAHRLASRYPDGQLFVDLQAHTAGQSPTSPSAALHMLLRQLGVPAERIPAALADRSAMWRTELAGQAALVVLDNAADADHVRPLLPGATESLVLITSRRRLIDLDGARALSLDVPPTQDAVALFTNIVGDRARADYTAVAEVLRLCGLLPLAVRIAAARLHHRPQWTVAYLSDRLRDERRRLAELATAERGVAAAFTLSYQHLPAQQQRMFRMLGLLPGRDVDAYAAAALTGVDVDAAEVDLEQLLDVHMLAQHEPDRYTFHDLLREHARTTSTEQDTEQTSQAALTRMLDHYRQTASAAIDVLYPETRHRRPTIHQTRPGRPFTARSASAWLDAERANLAAVCAYAADSDWPAHATSLSTILYRYLYDNAHHTDARTIYLAALAAGRRLGDHAAQSRASADLGWLAFGQGEYQTTGEHFQNAVDHAATAGDAVAQARALHGLGSAYEQQRDLAAATKHYTHSLELFRGKDDQFGEAVVITSLGAVQEQTGQYAQAQAELGRALTLFRAIGSRGGEADALDHLGRVQRRQGNLAGARDSHQQALQLYRQFGYRRGEARALNGLGAVAAEAGDDRTAVEHHQAALAVARDVGNRIEQARAYEGLACTQAGHSPAAARNDAARALSLYSELGEPSPQSLRAILDIASADSLY